MEGAVHSSPFPPLRKSCHWPPWHPCPPRGTRPQGGAGSPHRQGSGSQSVATPVTARVQGGGLLVSGFGVHPVPVSRAVSCSGLPGVPRACQQSSPVPPHCCVSLPPGPGLRALCTAVRLWAQESKGLGSNPRSALCWLCDLAQVTPALCASVSSYEKGAVLGPSVQGVVQIWLHQIAGSLVLGAWHVAGVRQSIHTCYLRPFAPELGQSPQAHPEWGLETSVKG